MDELKLTELTNIDLDIQSDLLFELHVTDCIDIFKPEDVAIEAENLVDNAMQIFINTFN